MLSLTLSSGSVWIRTWCLELVKALSDKYKVTITVHKEIESGASVKWLSKTPQDSDVIVRTPVVG
jgi:hypothetical protein